MHGQATTRRALLVGLAASSMLWPGALRAQTGLAATSAGVAGLRFRAIAVDASRVARTGSAGTADLIEQDLGREARNVFADRLSPGDATAPSLVIRIDSISLAAFSGANERRRGSSGQNDYLEGAGVVVGRGGQPISATPLLATLSAGYSGAWYLPDVDRRRIASLSYQFAYWLRREMGE